MTFTDAGNILVDYILGGIAFAAAASSACAGICAVMLSIVRRKK